MQVASCVGDLSGISSVVVGVIVDMLDSSIGQVDRVVALPGEDNMSSSCNFFAQFQVLIL